MERKINGEDLSKNTRISRWKRLEKVPRPKDLPISISLEANELLENFQWKNSEEAIAGSTQNIKEEMADILIYLIQMADKLEIDLEEEVYIGCKIHQMA